MTDTFGDLLHAEPVERLIPGDPSRIDQMSQSLVRLSEVFADAAQALGRVEVTWTGAAATAFRDEFDLQPSAFKTAARAFHDAGYALGSYAICLDSGRHAAATAVDLFQRGLEAARQARAGRAAIDPLGAALTAASATTVFDELELALEPAGLQDRTAGVEKLDHARADVLRTGHDTAQTLRNAFAAAPRQVTALEHAAAFVLPDLPLAPSQEKVDFLGGGARGAVEAVALAATSGNISQILTLQSLAPKVDDLEWSHGIDPRSGWHTGGSIILPAVASLGVEGLLARAGSLAAREATTGIRHVSARSLLSDLPSKGLNTTFRGAEAIATVTDRPSVDVTDLVLPARRHHILDGEILPNGAANGGHRSGTGFPGKSEFPVSWSDDHIMQHVVDVATDPASARTAGSAGDIFVDGVRDGIDIQVLLRNDELWSAYPTNVTRNP